MAGTNWYTRFSIQTCDQFDNKSSIVGHLTRDNFSHATSFTCRYQNNGCEVTTQLLEDAKVPLYSLAEVQLRFLCPTDLDEVRTLCQDWFPIEYPYYWYEEITSSNRYRPPRINYNESIRYHCSRFFALAAVYEHRIIGLIVAEIKSYDSLNPEDAGILPKSQEPFAHVGYILSLGVAKEYRRNGIASLLLDSFLRHLVTTEKKKVKAVFLHVLTANTAAIMFYEARKYVCTHFILQNRNFLA